MNGRQQPTKESHMKKLSLLVMMLALLVVASFSAQAAENQGPVEKFVAKNIDKVQTACERELGIYCSAVTPGEGRIVACLYAYGDRLSSKCEMALYESSQEFQQAAEKLSAFVEACEADIQKLCPTVEVGEGRILACLEKNVSQVSEKCNAVMKKANVDLGKKA
jgi:hypothetical protein